MTQSDPFIGRSIRNGTIELRSVIGDGGMGRVYKAFETNLDRVVAVKVLHPEHQAAETAVVYFEREARAASKLWHPNIIQIIDFGREADGTLYIVMEYVPGRNLADVIEQEFPIPLERTVRILAQILTALEVAHERGIVHRDLKPENIMLQDVPGNPDFVKVLDFGVAKALEVDSAGPMTMQGLVMGTPHFMSPEQALGNEIDSRSDLYSVGALAYQMLTAQLPFDGPATMNVLAKVISERAVPPSQRRPELDIDPALEAICVRAMRKSAKGRYQTASEFRDALLLLLEPGRARAVEHPASPPVLSEEISTDDLEPFRQRSRSKFTSSVFDFVARKHDADDSPHGEERVLTLLAVHLRLPEGDDDYLLAEMRRMIEAQTLRAAGLVLDHAGAVTTVAFGHPTPHEDDVRFAVNAGIAVADATSDIAPGAGVGIGIAYGKVFVPPGELSKLAGEPVEHAVGLASVAANDQILVHETAKRVATDLGFATAAGHAHAFIPRLDDVQHARRRTTPVAISVPLLGRSAEIGALREFIASLTEPLHPSAMVVVGGPGTGKSRMLKFVGREAEARGISVLEVASERFTAVLPGLPLARLARAAIELIPSNNAHHALTSLGLADDQIRLLQHLLLGAAAPNHGAFWTESLGATFVALFRALSARSPVLVTCDNFEAIDMLSFSVLSAMAERLQSEPVGLVFAGQPDDAYTSALVESFPSVTLGPLDQAAILGFLEASFPELDRSLHQGIVDLSEGKPLELGLAVEFLRTRIPRTITDLPVSPLDVLSSRLDELPDTARKLAAIAGALGASLPLDALSGACPPSWDLRGSLRAIGAAGLLSIFEDEDRIWLRFEPALLSRLALGQLLEDTRRQIHHRIAQHYERTRGKAPSPDHDYQWARHLFAAGYRREAVKMYAAAVDNAVKAFGALVALPAIDALLSAAVEVFPPDAKPLRAIVLKAATFMLECNYFDDALQLLERCDDCGSDAALLAERELLRGECLLGLGRDLEARAALGRALEVGSEAAGLLRAHAYLQLGLLEERAGRLAEALEHAERSTRYVRGDAETLPSQHKQLAWRPQLLTARIHLSLEAYEYAMPALLDGLRACDRQNDPVGRMHLNRTLAVALRATGKPQDARMAYGDALNATFACGDIEARLRVLHDLATLQVELGEKAGARGLFERGLALALDAGDTEMVGHDEAWLERLQARTTGNAV